MVAKSPKKRHKHTLSYREAKEMELGKMEPGKMEPGKPAKRGLRGTELVNLVPQSCDIFVSFNGCFCALLKTQYFLQSRVFFPSSGTLQGCIPQPVTRTLGKGSPLVGFLQFLRGAMIITLWFYLLLTSSKRNSKSKI